MKTTEEKRASRAAYMREYRARKPEARRKQAALTRAWYAKNRELCIQRTKDWNKQNPGAAVARARAYKKTPKGKRAMIRYQRRRAQWLRTAVGHASADQLRARAALYGGCCYLCRAPATMMDHVIPLAVRPIAWPANRRPICNRCNGMKTDHQLDEYRRLRG